MTDSITQLAGDNQLAIYTSMAEDTNSERLRINPASSQSGTQTRDHRVASPTLLPPGHAAYY